MSKSRTFIEQYLTGGTSEMIRRYDLPKPFAYTSGDGIFRSDSDLGKLYKFCRFGQTFNSQKRISQAWRRCITAEETAILREDHAALVFPSKAGAAVHFIKFYGLAPPMVNEGIRSDIRNQIKVLPCASCGTTKDIECDHKNDLWIFNDERIGIKATQTLADFQPLCKHCNDIKRAVKAKILSDNKRQPAPGFPHIPFLSGDSTFHKGDPKWYVGTYWGDVQAFKNGCFKKMR